MGGRMARGGRRLAVLALVVLTACTGGTSEPVEPSPTPTTEEAAPPVDDRDRVAIVVGPSSHVSQAEAAAYEREARLLAQEPPDDVAEVRVVRAEDAAFTADLVELFSDQGYDLVCVVGAGAAPLLLEAARTHRGTRLCGTDAAVEGGPGNVVAVVVDPVALTSVAAAAAQPEEPPVGLVVGPEVGQLEAVEPLLTSLLPPPPPPPEPEPAPTGTATPTPAPQPTPVLAVVGASTVDGSPVMAVESVLAAGPAVTVLLAPRTRQAVATAAVAGARSVVVDDWVRTPGAGERPDGVLLAMVVDRGAQLRAAVDAGLDPDSAQVQVLRLAEGVLDVERGSGRGAGGALTRARAVIADAEEG